MYRLGQTHPTATAVKVVGTFSHFKQVWLWLLLKIISYRQLYSRFSQLSPSKPAIQWHLYPLIKSSQLPPDWHGELAHSRISGHDKRTQNLTLKHTGMLTRWQSEILFDPLSQRFFWLSLRSDPKNKRRHLFFLRLTGTPAGANDNSQHKPQKKLEAESKCTTLTCACCIAVSAVTMATDALVRSNSIGTVCISVTRGFLAFINVWKWNEKMKELLRYRMWKTEETSFFCRKWERQRRE